MMALSIIHPYPLAIVLGFKSPENRTWRAPEKRSGEPVLGARIAIHASRAVDADEVLRVVEAAAGVGAWRSVAGLARVRDVLRECEATAGHIVGTATLSRCIERGDGDVVHGDYWRTDDRFAFVFTDPVRIARPVPCRGMQGFWQVPVVPADLVASQLARPGAPR